MSFTSFAGERLELARVLLPSSRAKSLFGVTAAVIVIALLLTLVARGPGSR